MVLKHLPGGPFSSDPPTEMLYKAFPKLKKTPSTLIGCLLTLGGGGVWYERRLQTHVGFLLSHRKRRNGKEHLLRMQVNLQE